MRKLEILKKMSTKEISQRYVADTVNQDTKENVSNTSQKMFKCDNCFRIQILKDD